MVFVAIFLLKYSLYVNIADILNEVKYYFFLLWLEFFFASLVLQEYIPYPNAINICIFNPSSNFESSFLYFAFKSIFNFLLIVYIE